MCARACLRVCVCVNVCTATLLGKRPSAFNVWEKNRSTPESYQLTKNNFYMTLLANHLTPQFHSAALERFGTFQFIVLVFRPTAFLFWVVLTTLISDTAGSWNQQRTIPPRHQTMGRQRLATCWWTKWSIYYSNQHARRFLLDSVETKEEQKRGWTLDLNLSRIANRTGCVNLFFWQGLTRVFLFCMFFIFVFTFTQFTLCFPHSVDYSRPLLR